MLFKHGILGSRIFKKYFLALYLKNLVASKKNHEILNINQEIQLLKKKSQDPFLTAAKVDKYEYHKGIIEINHRLLLDEIDSIISVIEKNFLWKFYKYLYSLLEIVMHGRKKATFTKNIDVDDLLFFNTDKNRMSVHHSVQRVIEKRMLSSLLMNQVPKEKFNLITSNHFEGHDHQAIFKAIQTSNRQNHGITVRTVSSILNRKNILNRVGGADYIMECAEFNGIFKINFDRLLSILDSFNQTKILKDKINDFVYEILDKPHIKKEEAIMLNVHKYNYKIKKLIDSNLDNIDGSVINLRVCQYLF